MFHLVFLYTSKYCENHLAQFEDLLIHCFFCLPLRGKAPLESPHFEEGTTKAT